MERCAANAKIRPDALNAFLSIRGGIMKRVSCSITKESYEDMTKAGRFNPCLEATFRDKSGSHTHKISAGYSDEVYAFRENGETFIFIAEYPPWLCRA